jgi:hypothetical protein
LEKRTEAILFGTGFAPGKTADILPILNLRAGEKYGIFGAWLANGEKRFTKKTSRA